MLTRKHQDKRLHVEFKDGEVADVQVLMVSECNEHEDCRGIVYDLISTNRPDRIRKGAAYWADLRDVQSFREIGE